MKNFKNSFSSITLMIFCLLVMPITHAKPPPSAAECDANLGVSVAVMDFGTYVGGTSGSIIMDVNGAMVHSGLVPVGGATGTPAIITLNPIFSACSAYSDNLVGVL